MKGHPSQARLISYLRIRTPEPEGSRISSHLDVCPACRARVETLRRIGSDFRQAFSDLMQDLTPPPPALLSVRCLLDAARSVATIAGAAAGSILRSLDVRPAFAPAYSGVGDPSMPSHAAELAMRASRSLDAEDPEEARAALRELAETAPRLGEVAQLLLYRGSDEPLGRIVVDAPLRSAAVIIDDPEAIPPGSVVRLVQVSGSPTTREGRLRRIAASDRSEAVFEDLEDGLFRIEIEALRSAWGPFPESDT